jgi:hypothetical protein
VRGREITGKPNQNAEWQLDEAWVNGKNRLKRQTADDDSTTQIKERKEELST